MATTTTTVVCGIQSFPWHTSIRSAVTTRYCGCSHRTTANRMNVPTSEKTKTRTTCGLFFVVHIPPSKTQFRSLICGHTNRHSESAPGRWMDRTDKITATLQIAIVTTNYVGNSQLSSELRAWCRWSTWDSFWDLFAEAMTRQSSDKRRSVRLRFWYMRDFENRPVLK